MLSYHLQNTNYHVVVYDTLNDLPLEHWQQIQGKSNNVFLSIDYLRVLECCISSSITTKFVVYYNQQQPVAIALMQQFYFKANESLKLVPNTKDGACFWNSLSFCIKTLLTNHLEFNALLFGSASISGPLSYYYDDASISNTTFEQLNEQFLVEAQRLYYPKTSSVLLLKDIAIQGKVAFNLSAIEAQPNMILSVASHWHTMADYLKDISSKYRVRYKKARESYQAFETKVLELEDIKAQRHQLHQLYEGIVSQTEFNLLEMPVSYWENLKQSLQEHFILIGYYLNGELVGFYTLIKNGTTLEAHLIGFQQALNTSHKIYLNMLYDMLEYAIEHGFSTLNFSRTATEIKSTLGAVPVYYVSYFLHSSKISNNLLKQASCLLQQNTSEFIIRHPFKTPASVGSTAV